MTIQAMCPYGRFLFHLISNLCKMEMLAPLAISEA